ncbi:MAG: OsmC family protein [Gemmobacter sp.]|uniref:OsmC family protein n=1 Tax=Gemmobacter sp. TaxID=1898957 RepID=UPI003919F8C6
MLEYRVAARRIDSHGSEATTKEARITIDTDMAGRADAFNPAELLLTSIAACILKGTERMIPMLKFDLRGIEVSLHGVRQDSPPKMVRINYEIVVDTDESDRRIDLLHHNLKNFGTIYNTVAEATELSGTIRRKD